MKMMTNKNLYVDNFKKKMENFERRIELRFKLKKLCVVKAKF